MWGDNSSSHSTLLSFIHPASPHSFSQTPRQAQHGLGSPGWERPTVAPGLGLMQREPEVPPGGA